MKVVKLGGVAMARAKKSYNESIKTFSWTVLDENCAVKRIDKSFVEYGEAQIPMDIKWFFNIENLGYKEEGNIQVFYKNSFYDIVVTVDKTKRAKMRFNSSLMNIIKNTKDISYDGQSVAVFRKDGINYYEMSIFKEL